MWWLGGMWRGGDRVEVVKKRSDRRMLFDG